MFNKQKKKKKKKERKEKKKKVFPIAMFSSNYVSNHVLRGSGLFSCGIFLAAMGNELKHFRTTCPRLNKSNESLSLSPVPSCAPAQVPQRDFLASPPFPKRNHRTSLEMRGSKGSGLREHY